MSFETLELFFRLANEFLLEKPNEHMEIIWHGGEPLLLGPGYFERALKYQRKHCPETFTRIRHGIQSNLTVLSEKFFEPFRKLGISHIGSSYDPIPNIRGIGKKRDWEAYNRRFMAAVSLLDKNSFNRGIIYVVTRYSLAHAVATFNFLTNLAPRGGIVFNPVLLYGSGLDHLKVTPREYADFLGKIFPAWWSNRKDLGHIEPFSSAARNIIADRKSLMCIDSGTCAYSHVAIMPDGRASHCGRSADWGLLDYGSIYEKPLSQIFSDPQREEFVQRNTVLRETECNGCRLWDICHGGCPLDGWSAAGSFLHKSEWCQAKRGFIEEYVEPAVCGSVPTVQVPGTGPDRTEDTSASIRGHEQARDHNGGAFWINPFGGLGDALMVSSVLKQVSERFPARKYKLVDRTKYREFLQGHPAIERIGHPPPGAHLVSTDYWRHSNFQRPGARAFQVLAGILGLELPVEEILYAPWEFADNAVIMERIPWQERNVLICPSSDSPRKEMSTAKWEALIDKLKPAGMGVVQVGRLSERYIRGAYSLLGLTKPRELAALIRHFDVVVTSDSFIMHAAKLCGVPAVVLWGPTDPRIYGYAGQFHLRSEKACNDYPNGCIGPGLTGNYRSACPKGANRCMDALKLETIYNAVCNISRPH